MKRYDPRRGFITRSSIHGLCERLLEEALHEGIGVEPAQDAGAHARRFQRIAQGGAIAATRHQERTEEKAGQG